MPMAVWSIKPYHLVALKPTKETFLYTQYVARLNIKPVSKLSSYII